MPIPMPRNLNFADQLKMENATVALFALLAELDIWPYDDEAGVSKCIQPSINQIHRFIKRIYKVQSQCE